MNLYIYIYEFIPSKDTYIHTHTHTHTHIYIYTFMHSITRRIISPQYVIDHPVDCIAVLREFCKVNNIFVRKISPRCDQHVINTKVSEYNEHFSNKDGITVLPTIPLEASLLSEDKLHLSEKGLCQASGITPSNLYQLFSPNSYKPILRRKSKPRQNAKNSSKAPNRKY